MPAHPSSSEDNFTDPILQHLQLRPILLKLPHIPHRPWSQPSRQARLPIADVLDDRRAILLLLLLLAISVSVRLGLLDAVLRSAALGIEVDGELDARRRRGEEVGAVESLQVGFRERRDVVDVVGDCSRVSIRALLLLLLLLLPPGGNDLPRSKSNASLAT